MPKFVKGHKKAGGKKKGSRHLAVITREALEKAIKLSDSKGDTTLLAHFVATAKKDNHVLIALMKKFLPDKKEVDAHVDGSISMLLKEIEDGSDRGLPNVKKKP